MNKKVFSILILFVFTLLSQQGVAGEEATVPSGFTPEQEFMFSIFKSRRSVRNFKSDPVPESHILKIIDMARTAPTSGNQQPWKFLVITEKDKIEELKTELMTAYVKRLKGSGITDGKDLDERKKRMAGYYANYLSAPVNIVVLTDSQSRYPSYNRHDGPLAAGYLILAARALGYGTVYATDSIPPEVTKKVFEIPDQYEMVCFVPLGVPVQWPEPKPKKDLKEFIVRNRFIEGVNFTRKEVKKSIELDDQIKKTYTGKYKLNEQVRITITFKDGQLFIQLTGQPQFPIFPESETLFFLKVVPATIQFNKAPGGSVNSLTLRQSGKEFTAEKTE